MGEIEWQMADPRRTGVSIFYSCSQRDRISSKTIEENVEGFLTPNFFFLKKNQNWSAFTLVAKSSRRNRLFPYSPCLYSHSLPLPTFPTSRPDCMSNEPALTCHNHPWLMVSIKVHSGVAHSVDADKYLMTFSCHHSTTPKSFISLKTSSRPYIHSSLPA